MYEATISGAEAFHLQLPANKHPLSALNIKGVSQVTQHNRLDTAKAGKWLSFPSQPPQTQGEALSLDMYLSRGQGQSRLGRIPLGQEW